MLVTIGAQRVNKLILTAHYDILQLEPCVNNGSKRVSSYF